jgi:hypothetical protein
MRFSLVLNAWLRLLDAMVRSFHCGFGVEDVLPLFLINY